MAIDRTKAYRKTWVNDRGWNLTLEIIPAGEFVNTSNNIDGVTYVPMNRGMMSIKSHKMSFDKMPCGVRDAASIEIEFDFAELQDNLKEMLKNPFYEHTTDGYVGLVTTNIFVLKSDRGTNLASEFIEFCGGQKATLSNSYKMRCNPATGEFVTQGCTVVAVDVMKLVLEQVSTQYWADGIFNLPADPNLGVAYVTERPYDYALTTGGGKYDFEPTSDGSNSSRVDFYYGAYLFNQGLVQATFLNLAAWTRNTPLTYNMTCENSPFTALEFYRQNLLTNHAKGTTLTDIDILIIGTVQIRGEEPHGGMLVKDKGGESYLEYKYLWDLLKNLCEGMCCKFTYKPLMIPDALTIPRLSYALSYDRIFHNPSNTVVDLTERFADAQEEDFEFTPCSGVYTSVTAELANIDDPDINHFESEITGTQSDERVNVKLVHHNLPTSDIFEYRFFGAYNLAEKRIHARKLYYHDSSGLIVKVHESTRINDSFTYTDYGTITALPTIVGSNTFASELRVTEAQGWAIATQTENGLPFAVSNFYLDRFSSNNQNEIPVTMFMVDGETMPENCGDIALIPVIDGFEGSEKAVMLGMEADWQRGTIDITFLTRGA